jgi:hypothetical protein
MRLSLRLSQDTRVKAEATLFVTSLVKQGKTIDEPKKLLYDEVRGNFKAIFADRKPSQPFCYRR